MPFLNPERRKEYDKQRRQMHGPRLRSEAAQWRNANRDYLREKNKHRRNNKRAMCLVAAARVRATRKNIPFSLTAEDVALLQQAIDDGRCTISGVPLTLGGGRSATSPSLDRIDPRRGYVSGNVRIVCHALNVGMGDWGERELRRIVAAWLSQ